MSGNPGSRDDRKVWNWADRDRNRGVDEKEKDKVGTGVGDRNKDEDGNGRDRSRGQRLNDRKRPDKDGDNDRRRHRDKDRGDRNDTMQGPIILLRRPTQPTPTTTSTTSATMTSTTPAKTTSTKPSTILHAQSAREPDRKTDRKYQGESSGGKDVKSHSARFNNAPAPAPVILQRPTKTLTFCPTTKNEDSTKAKELKTKPEFNKKLQKSKLVSKEVDEARKTLRPYKFQEKCASPVIDSHMKIQPLATFKFFNERGKLTGDYFIITAIGRPLSGKSTILSYLAGPRPRKTKKNSNIFSKRSRSHQMDSFLYITAGNIIFIEMASIFNCAAAHDLALQPGTLENTSLTWNLKLMRWALAVSHVVLVVCDTVLDPNICQLISSAEMIHPLESTLGEGVYPELIFVCNNVPQPNLNDDKLIQKYQLMLNTVAGRNPRIHHNFFMLPDTKSLNCVNRFKALKSAVKMFIRCNRAHNITKLEFTKIPQKYNAFDWYSNAIKVWESMQHPNYFAAYVKLCP